VTHSTLSALPLGIETNWFDPAQLTIGDPYLKNWLLDTGSLTERLQSQCREFRVQVLCQRPVALSLEENHFLQTTNSANQSESWQVREVILYGDNQPWVFARSLLPQPLCDNELAGLGDQPLGKMLFNDPRFKRYPFQITRMNPRQSWLNKVAANSEAGSIDGLSLWGRRSLFTVNTLTMSVAEVFLPQSPAYRNLR
jgi:chorismate lyase